MGCFFLNRPTPSVPVVRGFYFIKHQQEGLFWKFVNITSYLKEIFQFMVDSSIVLLLSQILAKCDIIFQSSFCYILPSPILIIYHFYCASSHLWDNRWNVEQLRAAYYCNPHHFSCMRAVLCFGYFMFFFGI